MSALVSIVTRTLGRDCLAEAAASVAEQRHRPLEWVVVDAAGTGLEAPPAGDVPVRVVSARTRLPRSRAANLGLDAAQGARILLLDDDDLVRADHVSRLAEALDAQPGVRLAYADVEEWSAAGVVANLMDIRFSPIVLARHNLFPPNAALFEASLFRRDACRVDETLEFCEDWDFWRQVAGHTTFLRVPGASAVYRTYLSQSGVGGGGTGASEARRRRDLATVRARFQPVRERYERELVALRAAARECARAGDLGASMAHWRAAGELDPYDVDAALRLAETQVGAGAWDDACRVIAGALERLPGEPALLRGLRAVVHAAKERGFAIEDKTPHAIWALMP